MSRPTLAQRVVQTRRLVDSEGYAGVLARLRLRAANRLAPTGGPIPVSREHLVRAAEISAAGWTLPPPLPHRQGDPLTVAWVCSPPSEGSGGHTTMFRLVSFLERAGHQCIVYLDDRHGWSLRQHRETIRAWWPWVRAEVRDAADGIEDAHALFATGWETAYLLLAAPARGTRFYLVQDFEPWFYAAGSEALLAEATYRFGFQGVTAGRWLAELLRREYGMAAGHFDFGRDDAYGLEPSVGERTGICLYARPEAPRRAFELATMTLDLFAVGHPEVDIHLYGRSVRSLPFAATNHGLLTPQQLNRLYNRCIAGLVLSATNVSLVPHEMLAAGCIPVVNDREHNRIVLDNPHVAYAPGTPFELAGALAALVERPAPERRAKADAAALSVRGSSWDDAGAAVEAIVRAAVQAARTPTLRRVV